MQPTGPFPAQNPVYNLLCHYFFLRGTVNTSLNRRRHGLGSPRVAGTLKMNVVVTALQENSASKLRVLGDCSVSWSGHWDVWAFTSEIRRHTACRDWHSEWWIFMTGSFQVALWGSDITKETEGSGMTQNQCIRLLKPAELWLWAV